MLEGEGGGGMGWLVLSPQCVSVRVLVFFIAGGLKRRGGYRSDGGGVCDPREVFALVHDQRGIGLLALVALLAAYHLHTHLRERFPVLIRHFVVLQARSGLCGLRMGMGGSGEAISIVHTLAFIYVINAITHVE